MAGNLADVRVVGLVDRGPVRPVVPERLLSLMDKAKLYPLFQKGYPDALAGVLHAATNTVNYYDNFKLWIRDVWRFEQEDMLVFRIDLGSAPCPSFSCYLQILFEQSRATA
jgi:hypothetical protein